MASGDIGALDVGGMLDGLVSVGVTTLIAVTAGDGVAFPSVTCTSTSGVAQSSGGSASRVGGVESEGTPGHRAAPRGLRAIPARVALPHSKQVATTIIIPITITDRPFKRIITFSMCTDRH